MENGSDGVAVGIPIPLYASTIGRSLPLPMMLSMKRWRLEIFHSFPLSPPYYIRLIVLWKTFYLKCKLILLFLLNKTKDGKLLWVERYFTAGMLLSKAICSKRVF